MIDLFSRPSTGWSARDSKPSQERVEKSETRAKRSREGEEGAEDEESNQDTETQRTCAKPLRSTRQRVEPSQRRDKRRGTGGAGKDRGTNVDDLAEVGEGLPGGRDVEVSLRSTISKVGQLASHPSQRKLHTPGRGSRWWCSTKGFLKERGWGTTGEGGHRADRKKSAQAPATSPSTPERRRDADHGGEGE